MAKLTIEYRIELCVAQIDKLKYAIDKAQYNLKNKKDKLKLALKKMKDLQKQSVTETKVVSIKRGHRKAIA